jgi:hypothetical protein
MWIPNQLLRDEVVQALRLALFPESQIEFLGWLSYNAAALNNSRNPVRAAHTLLGKETNLRMVDKFIEKKKDSVIPAKKAEHDAADDKFSQLAKWEERRKAEEANAKS